MEEHDPRIRIKVQGRRPQGIPQVSRRPDLRNQDCLPRRQADK